ncbi:MAG TPA: AEC family transporter [Caldimonas sp.]|nr:AEC family transporter [Caldimonas sp.]HEX2541037.1 AEC family transporter [Caldimonas sp.]
MSVSLALLPDFLLILLGWLICRHTALDRPLWEGVERLVYYLLFPVLLFNSILRTPLQPAQTAGLALAGVGTVALGIVLALAIGRWPRVDSRLHASGAQVAYRFNSYVALALSERLFGAQGLAWMALLIALSVPLCNVAAVWPLARHGGHSYLREIVRNPLIVSTAAGLAANGLGLVLPDAVSTTLQRIGLAALPLGLMAVGAGLTFGALKASPALAAALLAIRHAVLPAAALAIVAVLVLSPAQASVVVLFAALPTASSAYVLATRMGGDGVFVAGLVTVSTLLGMVSVPLWLSLQQALR